eukprot:scaffold422150_cov15-Prasinocladus_malaysianus.AAC.1
MQMPIGTVDRCDLGFAHVSVLRREGGGTFGELSMWSGFTRSSTVQTNERVKIVAERWACHDVGRVSCNKLLHLVDVDIDRPSIETW